MSAITCFSGGGIENGINIAASSLGKVHAHIWRRASVFFAPCVINNGVEMLLHAGKSIFLYLQVMSSLALFEDYSVKIKHGAGVLQILCPKRSAVAFQVSVYAEIAYDGPDLNGENPSLRAANSAAVRCPFQCHG